MSSSFICPSSSNPSANPKGSLFNEIFQARFVASLGHLHTNLCLLLGLEPLPFVGFPVGFASLSLSSLVALSSSPPGSAIPSCLVSMASRAHFRLLPLRVEVIGKLGVAIKERGEELAEQRIGWSQLFGGVPGVFCAMSLSLVALTVECSFRFKGVNWAPPRKD